MHTDLLQDLCKIQWGKIRAIIQQQWGNITEQELESIAGDYGKLITVLQKKYGYSIEKAREEVQQCVSPYERPGD